MFPLVSDDLLEELEIRFPQRSPNSHEKMEQLMFRGGQRSVVDFIKTMHAEQKRENRIYKE